MKIRRFNENTSEYISIGNIRDIFLYWIEESDIELEISYLEDSNDDSYDDLSTDSDEISEGTYEIVYCLICIPETIHKVNIKDLNPDNFKKLADFTYKMMESVQTDLKQYNYNLTLNTLPNRNGEIELSISKI